MTLKLRDDMMKNLKMREDVTKTLKISNAIKTSEMQRDTNLTLKMRSDTAHVLKMQVVAIQKIVCSRNFRIAWQQIHTSEMQVFLFYFLFYM